MDTVDALQPTRRHNPLTPDRLELWVACLAVSIAYHLGGWTAGRDGWEALYRGAAAAQPDDRSPFPPRFYAASIEAVARANVADDLAAYRAVPAAHRAELFATFEHAFSRHPLLDFIADHGAHDFGGLGKFDADGVLRTAYRIPAAPAVPTLSA